MKPELKGGREEGVQCINRLCKNTSSYMCQQEYGSGRFSLPPPFLTLVPICGLPSPWRRSASETIHRRNKYWGAPCVYMCMQTFLKRSAQFTHRHLQPSQGVKKKNLFTIEHNKCRQQMSNVAWNLSKILSQVPPTRTFSTSICNVFNFIYIAPLSLSLSHTHTHTHTHACTQT